MYPVNMNEWRYCLKCIIIIDPFHSSLGKICKSDVTTDSVSIRNRKSRTVKVSKCQKFGDLIMKTAHDISKVFKNWKFNRYMKCIRILH